MVADPIASAIAPLSYALARDWTGRYLSAAWILIPICLLLFASAVTLRPPRRRAEEPATS